MAAQRQARGGILDRDDGVSVLREDPSLARHVAPSEAETARPRAVVSVVSLRKGVFWPHERFPNESGTLGMLLLDGMLLRGVGVADRSTVDVLAPGDVFRPFELARDPDAMVSAEVCWWALTPARAAVLDARLISRMSSYPEVIAELVGRLWRRSAASSLRLAIVQEPHLAVRLHWTLWQLADRFGEAQPEGMWLRVPLCHALLSWLVGARRPAMSRAVNELERTGRLARCPDGTWWLGRQRPEGLGEPALPAQPLAA